MLFAKIRLSQKMGEGEECGDVLEAIAVTVTQVRRDRWWFWGGRVEMEKGRI